MNKLYKNNVRISDYSGINRLLQRVINGVLQDEISEDKARVISTLCNTLLKSLDSDLDKTKKETDIEYIKARIENISAVGSDVEYLGDVFKQIYGETDLRIVGGEDNR